MDMYTLVNHYFYVNRCKYFLKYYPCHSCYVMCLENQLKVRLMSQSIGLIGVKT